MKLTRIRRHLSAVAAVVLTAALAACGTADSDPQSGSAAQAAPGAGVAAVQGDFDRWIKGTSVAPPVADSPKAAAGKHIWIISCGQSNASCARGTKGAQDAAAAIGWEATVYDTKGNLSTAGDGIRQAIAGRADGIFMYFIDCSYAQQPLAEAKAAGIPVVQAEGIDCNIADPKSPSLFTHSVSYEEGPLLTWLESFGASLAALLVTETNGRGNILFVADNVAIGTQNVIKGYKREMAKCPDCTSEVVEYSFDQLTAGVSQQVQQKLLQKPDTDAVGVAYDGILQGGVSVAVLQSIRGGRHLVLAAGEGSAPTMDLVRKGSVVGGSGLDNEWEGWSGVDNLNRIMQGAPGVGSGIGIQLYDKEHNVPASGPYVATVDYQAAYRKAWAR
ncbi:substrate-binding domain-containing protein [Intrasporangium sp.]|uniref:sugar ABC transporter substrate-binding protein n=1 Tax=Intrasporangium sp. TaxID=1925024 RepID=UPI0032220BEC